MKPRLASAERRQSILDAAIPLFARKGFAGTTTREIAEAAGVSEALVFKYFESKTALYDAMFASCGDVNPGFERVHQLDPSTDTLLQIIELCARHFAGIDGISQEYELSRRLFLRSLFEDGEFARAAFRALAGLLPQFTDCYEAARQAGDLVDDAPEADAAFWFMAQTALSFGSLSASNIASEMRGFSYRDMLQGVLRGIGLREDAVARAAESTISMPRAAVALAAAG